MAFTWADQGGQGFQWADEAPNSTPPSDVPPGGGGYTDAQLAQIRGLPDAPAQAPQASPEGSTAQIVNDILARRAANPPSQVPTAMDQATDWLQHAEEAKQAAVEQGVRSGLRGISSIGATEPEDLQPSPAEDFLANNISGLTSSESLAAFPMFGMGAAPRLAMGMGALGSVPENIGEGEYPQAALNAIIGAAMMHGGPEAKPESAPNADAAVRETMAPTSPEQRGMTNLPGTTADDVSRALERRFTMQPEPPPDIAQSPELDALLASLEAPRGRISPETGQAFYQPPETEFPQETARIPQELQVQKVNGKYVQQKAVSRSKFTAPAAAPAVGEQGQPQAGVAPRQAVEIPPEEARYAGVEQPQAGLRQGINNAAFDEAYGKGEVEPGTGKGADEWRNIGDRRLANWIRNGDVADDPYAALSQARTRGAAPASDVALMAAEHRRLLNDAAIAQESGVPDWQQKNSQAYDLAQGIQQVKGMPSDAFRAMQESTKPTFDNLADFDAQIRNTRSGEGLNPQEQALFKPMSQEIAKGTRLSSDKLDAALDTADRATPKSKKISLEDANKMVSNQIEQLTKPCNL